MSNTAEYKIWEGIVQRCTNPNCRSFPDYGGRGILMCREWRSSFSHFLRSVGPRPAPHL